MVQSISLDPKDIQLDSKNKKPTTSSNTDFLELLLKDIKDKDIDEKELSDSSKDTTKDSEKDLKSLLSNDNPKFENIKLTDLMSNTKDNNMKLNDNDIKEIKNIITSQLKQNNVLLSKQDVNDFKKMDNLKDLVDFADKKGLNIEKLKFDISKTINVDNKDKLIEPKDISSTKIKLDDLQKEPTKPINTTKQTQTKHKTISLENILNKKSEVKSESKLETPITHKASTQIDSKAKNIEKTTIIPKTIDTKDISKTSSIEKEIKTTNKELKTTAHIEKKPIDLTSLLNPNKEEKIQKIEPKKQSLNEHNLNITNQNMVNEIKAKSVQAKETIKHFNQNLDEAIKNYKPPISKVNIELNPKNLGKVDVTIVQRGNNIQVHMNTDQSNVQLFQQNQAEFRQALSNIGFSNIDMSFNSNQDRDRKQNQAKKTYKENENIDSIDNIEAGNIEIKANYQYA